jgi:hypothetical protein
MSNKLTAAVPTAAIIVALALPLPTVAATTAAAPSHRYQLETRMVSQYEAGEYDGTLALTVYPNGIVQGNYRPQDGNIRTVTGGLDGRNIWFDIGPSGRFRIIGTFENGVLKGVVQRPGPDTVTFDGVPAGH